MAQPNCAEAESNANPRLLYSDPFLIADILVYAFHFAPEAVHPQKVGDGITVVIDADFIDCMTDFNAFKFWYSDFQFAPIHLIVTVV